MLIQSRQSSNLTQTKLIVNELVGGFCIDSLCGRIVSVCQGSRGTTHLGCQVILGNGIGTVTGSVRVSYRVWMGFCEIAIVRFFVLRNDRLDYNRS